MAHSKEVIIRRVKRGELQALMSLIEAHAVFEGASFVLSNQKEDLASKIFESVEPLHCLVAVHQGFPIGYATYIRQYSTWDASYYLYLDCLYFQEEFRGRGLGKRLMEVIKKEAQEMGCSHIQWQTPDFNAQAIAFYRKIGAVSKAKERFFLDLA